MGRKLKVTSIPSPFLPVPSLGCMASCMGSTPEHPGIHLRLAHSRRCWGNLQPSETPRFKVAQSRDLVSQRTKYFSALWTWAAWPLLGAATGTWGRGQLGFEGLGGGAEKGQFCFGHDDLQDSLGSPQASLVFIWTWDANECCAAKGPAGLRGHLGLLLTQPSLSAGL